MGIALKNLWPCFKLSTDGKFQIQHLFFPLSYWSMSSTPSWVPKAEMRASVQTFPSSPLTGNQVLLTLPHRFLSNTSAPLYPSLCHCCCWASAMSMLFSGSLLTSFFLPRRAWATVGMHLRPYCGPLLSWAGTWVPERERDLPKVTQLTGAEAMMQGCWPLGLTA